MKTPAARQRRRVPLPGRSVTSLRKAAARPDPALRAVLRAPEREEPQRAAAPPLITARKPAASVVAVTAPAVVSPAPQPLEPAVTSAGSSNIPQPAPATRLKVAAAPRITTPPPQVASATSPTRAVPADGKPAAPVSAKVGAEVDPKIDAKITKSDGARDTKAPSKPEPAAKPEATAVEMSPVRASGSAQVTVPPAVSREPTAPRVPATAGTVSKSATEPAAQAAGVDRSKAAGDAETAVPEPSISAPAAAKSPEFVQLKQQVRRETLRQRKLPTVESKRQEVVDAAVLSTEQQSDQSSKDKNTTEMGEVATTQQRVGARFDSATFKRDFEKLIATQSPPRSEGEVKQYVDKQPMDQFPAAMSSSLAEQQSRIAAPLQKQTREKPTPDAPQAPGDISEASKAPAPRPIDPTQATPKPQVDWDTWTQRQNQKLDGAMQTHRLTDEQLAASREPKFLQALDSKQQAQQQIATTPDNYRAREAEVLQGAAGGAQQSLVGKLHGMNAAHRKTGTQVHADQHHTKGVTQTRQEQIKGVRDGIYKATVSDVQLILTSLPGLVETDFAASLKLKSDQFNKDVRARISKYYGNWRIDDKLFGPADVVVNDDGTTRALTIDEILGRSRPPGKTINPDVYDIFVDAKQSFVTAMGVELDRIAKIVETQLTAAATRIESGRQQMDTFKKTLRGDERKYAEQLQEEVESKFEQLEGSIDATREDLLQALADQYTESLAALETTFHEINDELKQGWLDKAIDFIETVGRTIYQLYELLMSILSRMASLLWDIIQHPIRFFETLVAGLGQGIRRFIDGFTTYLEEAFWGWITGAAAVRNVRLTGGSTVETLFNLVVQVVDLGPRALREIVAKVFGRSNVERLESMLAKGEKAVEPIAQLFTKGPLAWWEQLKEHVAGAVRDSFDRIKRSVFYGFIEQALKWIAGFFVPGGAFVKIVKAIFRAFQFVVDNLQNLKQFFDSIFDAMEDALAGRTEGVANKVIQGLKLGIVLALDFLAKQIGLGKIVDSARKIIQSLRKPIVQAITWVLKKIKPAVMRIVRAVAKGARKVVQKGRAVAAKVRDWWRARKPFKSESGEPHTLYLEGSRSSARLMIRSEPQSYASFIQNVVVSPRKQAAKDTAAGIAKELDQAVADATGGASRRLERDPSAQIATLLDRLAAATATFIPQDKPESSVTVYGPLVHGFGSSARVARLTKVHASGGAPSVEGGHWDALTRRRNGKSTYYIRGHLLNDHLGGPGNRWDNLTPLTRSANARMSSAFEETIKSTVQGGKRVNFKVTAHYGRTHPLASWVPDLARSESPDDRSIADIVRAEQYVPTSVVAQAQAVLTNGEERDLAPAETFANEIGDASIDDYQLDGDPAEPLVPFYINDHLADHRAAQQLLRLKGVTATVIDKLLADKPASGYRNIEQLAACGLDLDVARTTPGLRVRIHRRGD